MHDGSLFVVVRRLDAGPAAPPQVHVPIRLNIPVLTFSGYTDTKPMVDFLDDLAA